MCVYIYIYVHIFIYNVCLLLEVQKLHSVSKQRTTMSFSYTLGSSSSFSSREVVTGQRLGGMLTDIWKL